MASLLNDAQRQIQFKGPSDLGLVVYSMTGTEEMGRLYQFKLGLLSEKNDIAFSDIVGQTVTVALELKSGKRYFNGYVTEFRYTGENERYSVYEATVRPWLWFLTRTSDCRIFQQGLDGINSVPDIIKAVFRDNGMTDFDDRLTGHYRDWVYCVQYRETDFNFVSRLMEQEGIYYFFEHVEGKHTLVLADDLSAHQPFEGADEVPYFPPSGDMRLQKDDHIEQWIITQSIVPQKYAVAEYDFKKPKVELLSRLNNASDHAYPLADAEIYDYPGEFKESRDGENYAELRLHELQCEHERVHGGGPVRTLAAGYLFSLSDHPRQDQNREYLTLSVAHKMSDESYFSGGGTAPSLYSCKMEVLKSDLPFRPARITPKPVVQGCQSAIVCGPSSEEIYTDPDGYGQVKVQFYWDRYGKRDENSSCWIRVSQLWAGKGWGGIHIPRIGQEVLVSFLEGDPDQPIITGRVYNAENMPPYTLEQNKTQSGIKSRSTKGGGEDNFNEIRMEDKIGSEELYIQAEKDENILVKNDKGETVGHNETISIGKDRKESVGNDETLSVKNDRKRDVGNDESVTVGASRAHSVGKNESISIGNNQTVSIKKDHLLTIDKNQTVTIGEIQGISIGEDRKLTIGKDYAISVAKDETRDVAKKLVIDVGDSVLIKCGEASISMKKNGDIQIKGKNLTLGASGKISAKASGAVSIKGSKISEN